MSCTKLRSPDNMVLIFIRHILEEDGAMAMGLGKLELKRESEMGQNLPK